MMYCGTIDMFHVFVGSLNLKHGWFPWGLDMGKKRMACQILVGWTSLVVSNQMYKVLTRSHVTWPILWLCDAYQSGVPCPSSGGQVRPFVESSPRSASSHRVSSWILYLGCAWYMHAVLIYILHFFKTHAYHCISICIHTHTMHIRWMCWVDLPSRTRSKMPSLGGIWGQQMCSKHDLTVKAKVEIDPSADSSSTAFMVEHTKPGGKILVS